MIILDELKDDDIPDKLDYFRNLFLEEKVIGFNKFNVSNIDRLNSLIMRMADCHEREVIVTTGNQHKGQDRVLSDRSEKQYKDFIYFNIHSDISEVAEPNLAICRLIGMVMDVFTCPSEYGRTFFLDREKMLEATPNNIREWMKQIHVVGLIGQKDVEGVNGLDWQGAKWPLRNMPGIVTHPITGVDNFSFTSYKHKVVAEDMSLESEYEEFLNDYLHDDANWMTWEWQEGKAIIWDNANLLHTYSPGWKDDERVFTRLQGGFAVPYHKWGSF